MCSYSRLSVKRISQQAKDELAKQSAQEEAFIRRASIADAVSVCVCVRGVRTCTRVCVWQILKQLYIHSTDIYTVQNKVIITATYN